MVQDLTEVSRITARRRFLLRSFVVGACAPAAWICAGYALRSVSVSSGLFDGILFAIACTTFPTFILFLDTEHLPEIIFMLLIAMPLNGAWFALASLGLWYLREGLSRLRMGGART